MIKKKLDKHKLIFKRIGFTLLLVLLFLNIFSCIGETFIKKKIENTPNLSVKNIHISWLCNSLYAMDVHYKNENNNILFKEVYLTKINWFSLFKNKTIHFKEIHLEHGNIYLSTSPSQNKASFTNKLNYNFVIDKVSTNNTSLELHKQSKTLSVKNIIGVVYNVNATTNSIRFKSIKYTIADGIYNDAESPYLYTWKNIASKKQKIDVYNFKLNPKLTEKEWTKKYTYKKPRTTLNIPKLTFNKFDYNTFINKDSLSIKNITLKNALLTVLANENKEPNPNAYKPLLNEILYKLKTPVRINNIKLINNRIDINVISKATQKKALIYFNKINATFYDVQNTKNHKINLNLKALVLNKNTINLDINFWIKPKLYPYTIKGNVSPFNFEQFNSFLLLNKRIRIRSGECTRLDFSIYGNNKKAYGDIILDYKNIEIGLFDNDEFIVKKLPTFLINNFLIKQNNIPNTQKYRTGNMFYKRPQNRSMFHSWWYTLKSGFQSVILPNIVNPKELNHKTHKYE